MSERANSAEPETGGWSEVLTGRLAIYTVILNLGVTLFGINLFVVATVMPTVVADLGGLDYYTWAFSLFAVGAIIGAAGSGPLRDAVGIRAAYIGAGLLLALGLAGSALANGMLDLVAWRLVQGIGGGAIGSLAYAIVASVFPERLRGKELSIVSTIWGVATVGGPGLGALFAAPGTWRGAFWLLMAFTLLFAWLAWRYVEGERGHGELARIPLGRLGLLALAVLLMSATTLTARPWIQAGLVMAAVLAAAAAFMSDARAEHSIFPRQATALFTEMGATYWIFFLISVVLAFTNTYTTLYLQRLHDIPPLSAGYLFSIQSLMWTVSALLVVEVKPRLMPVAIVAGLALVVLAAIAVWLTVDTGPVIVIAVALAVSGFGIGILNNPAIQYIMAVAPAAERHVAGASVQAIRNMGLSLGAAASGLVAATAGLTDHAPRETVALAMRWVFGVNVLVAIAALAVAGLVLELGRRRAQGG